MSQKARKRHRQSDKFRRRLTGPKTALQLKHERGRSNDDRKHKSFEANCKDAE